MQSASLFTGIWQSGYNPIKVTVDYLRTQNSPVLIASIRAYLVYIDAVS